jgi:hypothetical protein
MCIKSSSPGRRGQGDEVKIMEEGGRGDKYMKKVKVFLHYYYSFLIVNLNCNP